MKLRRIDILGFKSFRTKTGLEIADGVTSIVGPNGCGKSNVVDAIRWSIGSQSPKDLRGRAMEDVIFAGSENHKPMGFAEVNLTLANDGRDVPVEWKEHAEIRVTRRLFRTGESEYEINGTRCRLRDIHQLFLGTGVGAKEAYSIIEQGRIGFIVAARPEERRVLIEEAAGITRYKFQRQTAQRRLEKTKDNLTRVHDVLAEVERQLGSLQRQARKAARWRELTEEKRALEVRSALDRRERAAQAMEAAEAKQTAAAVEAEKTRVALTTADAKAAKLRTEAQLEEHALNKATEAAFAARSRRDLLANNLDHHERERASLEERRTRLRERREEQQAMEAQAARDLERTVDAAATATAEVAHVTEALEKAERALREARGAESEAASESDRLSAAVTRARSEAAAVEARLEAGASELEALTARVAHAEQEVAATEAAVSEAAAFVTTAEAAAEETAARAASMAEELQAARAEERDASAGVNASRSALRDASAAAQASNARVSALEGVLARGEGYGEGARAALRAVERGELNGVGRPIAERLRVAPEDGLRLSAVAGVFLDALVAEDASAAAAFVDWARAQGVNAAVAWGPTEEGAITSWLRAAAPVPASVCRRLRAVSVADSAEALLSGEGEAVTEDGAVYRPAAGVAVVGGGSGAAQSVVQLAADLEEARAAAVEASAAVAPAESAVRASEERLERALAARASAAEAAEAASSAARAATQAVSESRAALGRAERAAEGARSARGSAAERRSRLESGLAVDRDRVESARAERARSEAAVAELMQTLPNLREAVQAQADAVAELKANRARATERAAGLKTTEERLRQTLHGSSRQAETLAREVEQLAETLEQTQERMSADRRALAAATEAQEDADRALATARARHDAVAERLLGVEAEMHGVRKTHGGNAERLRAAELAAERARNDLQHAEEALLERFEVTLAAAREIAAGRPFDAAALETLKDVTGKLDRLGPVNPAAEEEFSEANERFEYLSGQKEDLETAMADLEAAIRKMDRTSRDLFASTYREVNERFQVLFPRLFEGGSARLELTEPDDLLNTGVEVVVSPPGKRLQSMTLLSGGEKALTAVALIFSIFQLKPTPFCILDEVDAPLDDANVARFAEMVREMSATSQFILITHNKRSMEAAGTLYGVTMQEPGVSKVVGVRMPDRSPPRETTPSAETGPA